MEQEILIGDEVELQMTGGKEQLTFGGTVQELVGESVQELVGEIVHEPVEGMEQEQIELIVQETIREMEQENTGEKQHEVIFLTDESSDNEEELGPNFRLIENDNQAWEDHGDYTKRKTEARMNTANSGSTSILKTIPTERTYVKIGDLSRKSPIARTFLQRLKRTPVSEANPILNSIGNSVENNVSSCSVFNSIENPGESNDTSFSHPVQRGRPRKKKREFKQDVCRLCLAKYGKLLPLFATELRFSDTPVSNAIEAFVGLKVSENDSTELICQACVTNLENMWEFRDKCQQCDSVLKEMIVIDENRESLYGMFHKRKRPLNKSVGDNANRSHEANKSEVTCSICSRKIAKESLNNHLLCHKNLGEGRTDEVADDDEMDRPVETEELIVSQGSSAEEGETADGLVPLLPSEKVPGCRANSWVYTDSRGYYYYSSHKNEKKRYLVCTEMNCRVRATMRLEECAPIIYTNPLIKHNHRPNFELAEKMKFVYHFKKRSIEEAQMKITDIIRAEKVEGNIPGLVLNEFNVRRAMLRARKTYLPPPPENREEEDERPSVRFPGRQSGCWIYTDGRGYFYRLKKKTKGRRHLRCIDLSCEGLAVMKLEDNAPIRSISEHSHPPSSIQFSAEEQTGVMKKLTVENETSFAEDEEARTKHGVVLNALNLKRTMKRARDSTLSRAMQEQNTANHILGN